MPEFTINHRMEPPDMQACLTVLKQVWHYLVTQLPSVLSSTNNKTLEAVNFEEGFTKITHIMADIAKMSVATMFLAAIAIASLFTQQTALPFFIVIIITGRYLVNIGKPKTGRRLPVPEQANRRVCTRCPRMQREVTNVRAFTDALKVQAKAYLDEGKKLTNVLSKVRQQFTEHRKNVNITSIAGSTTGSVGTALTIAGAVLAPFTFGAVLITGLAVSGIATVLNGGGKITEYVLVKKAKESTAKQAKDAQDALLTLQKCTAAWFQRVLYEHKGLEDFSFIILVQNWKLEFESNGLAIKDHELRRILKEDNMSEMTIFAGQAVVTAGRAVLGAADDIVHAAVPLAPLAAGAAVKIAGTVALSAVGLGVDGYNAYNAVKNMRNGNQSEFVTELGQQLEQLEKQENLLDQFFNEVYQGLTNVENELPCEKCAAIFNHDE